MSTTTARRSAPWRADTGRAVVGRPVMAAFLLEVVLAGGNAVAIRFSNRELAPLWGAGLRFGLAAVVLAAVMVAMRLRLPRGRALVGSMLYGALTFGGGFALVYYALLELHAGFGQVQAALTPLATLLVAAAWRQERLRPAGVIGAATALAGVVVMSRMALHGPVPLLSLLAALGAVLCFAQGAVLVRRFPPVHPVTANVVGMATATAILLTGSALASESWVLPSAGATWGAVAYLVVIGSGVVFVLYVYVLRHWTASRAAYGFVLIPFVTVAVSARLDAEPVGIGLVVGGALVLAGVYLGALRGQDALAGGQEHFVTRNNPTSFGGTMPTTATQLVAEAQARVENLTTEQVAREADHGAVLVDLREPAELDREGMIAGAVRAPRGMLEFWADPSTPYHRPEFQPDRRTILYCASGGRSALAAQVLGRLGYTDVAHLDGGIKAWKQAGCRVVRPGAE